jgi:hypothetical protein
MNFLDMSFDAKLPLDHVWYRGVSGTRHHWFKNVMEDQIQLHVEGSEDVGGYWGTIHNAAVDYDIFPLIFSTKPELGLHVPFKTPENCALHLDEEWKRIINDEVNRNKI